MYIQYWYILLYYKETRELIITIIYVDDVCFIGLKDSPLLLELKQKFITK